MDYQLMLIVFGSVLSPSSAIGVPAGGLISQQHLGPRALARA